MEGEGCATVGAHTIGEVLLDVASSPIFVAKAMRNVDQLDAFPQSNNPSARV